MKTAVAPLLVDPSTSDFWEAVGIFPEALTHGDKLAELQRKTRKSLHELGQGNQKFLCEQAKIPRAHDASQDDLVKLLSNSAPAHTLIHLREFMQRRVAEIEETFTTRFTDGQRKSFEGDIGNLSNATEQMKVLTKLVLLYRQSPAHLRDIYYLKLSRSRPTSFEYESEGKIPADAVGRIDQKAAKLEYEIGQLKKGQPIRFQGCHRLPSGTIVVSVLRQYSPKVQPDFREDQPYNLHYGYGHIVFSVHPDRNRVDVRCKSSRIAETIEVWLAGVLGVKLKSAKGSIFANYDPEQVVKRLLGDYPADAGIDMVAMKFRRTILPSQSSLTVAIGPHQASVKDDLEAMKANGTIHTRSVLDIESLAVNFKTQTAKITTETTRGGAIRLCFDNTSWDDELEGEFRTAFEKTFLLPLDRAIDPTKLAMGDEGVIGHLLSVKSKDQVQHFQKDSFDKLVATGVLQLKPERTMNCTKPGCDQKPIAALKTEECPRCGTKLVARDHVRVFRNPKEIKAVVSGILTWPGCSLGADENQFESVKYHPLRFTDAGGQRRVVSVLIRDAVPDSTKTKLERSSRALLTVKGRTPDRPVYLDESGVGQVSLAYLLAAREVVGGEAEARDRCKELLQTLQRDHTRRIHQSGLRSYEVLKSRFSSVTDDEFETEIYNVLRSLFPESIKLGRKFKNEPDGLVGFPWFQDGSLRDGRLWTCTYDAKLAETAKPYDFDRDEYRKMKEYIEIFRASRYLYHKTNRVMSHVLISNNITETRIKGAAEYLISTEGLKDEDKEVTVALMLHTFLIKLYERVRDREDDFRRRGPHLAFEMKERLARPGKAGYVILTEDDANELADAVLDRDEVHPGLDEPKVLRDLDK